MDAGEAREAEDVDLIAWQVTEYVIPANRACSTGEEWRAHRAGQRVAHFECIGIFYIR